MSFDTIRKAMICGASACLLVAGAAPAPATAGTLQVDPVRLEISRDRRSATITVTNQEQAPIAIRAYGLEWSQVEGEDVYRQSSAVIISPPIFTIPAGGRQTLRVGLRAPAAAGRAYRVMIEEVPEAAPQGGVRVALRLNLPLFAMVNPGAAADIEWAAWQGADRRWIVEATNRGSGYVRVETDQARAATGIGLAGNPGFGVVLPGGSRRWVIGERPDLIDRARFESIVRRTQSDPAQLASRLD